MVRAKNYEIAFTLLCQSYAENTSGLFFPGTLTHRRVDTYFARESHWPTWSIKRKNERADLEKRQKNIAQGVSYI